jgi:prohibitin 1
MRDPLLQELSRYEDPTRPRRTNFGDRFAQYAVVLLLVFLVALFLFPQMVATVYSGEAGVLWDRFSGTRVNVVFGEGIHLIAPWNHFYRYDVRIQSVTLESEALSQSGLPIKVGTSVRFRIAGAPFVNVRNVGDSAENSLGVLHKRIGPDYKDKLVIPVVDGAVRQVLGQYTAEELYRTQRQHIQDQIVAAIVDRRTKEQFADERTIDLIDVLIRSVTLPDAVRIAIEKKMAEEQAMLAYDFTLRKEEKEAQRRSIEANGIRAFNDRIKTIDNRVLQWKSIEANLELAKSPNAKVVVVVGGSGNVPVLLGLSGDASSIGKGQH